ncbi:DNA double-strand break repair nuclease NurA [Methanonatronarchaeum sp. AMET-Sl]|uniref:DNA double-strand break repair nuclease NurA n=1 Tax=Methanonatronarchaeum sp. AMET-Sl TaxID=3037654 RepID=UPI00244DC87D|nr:DNA double-strand break repair nuclease NurA [Methanonatronarchaeum sp. AMET-Sl]WGI17520.1 DNA double-strand break repair nuclease NurA [Methanonatronarchaeum sp. AMET-Sl]
MKDNALSNLLEDLGDSIRKTDPGQPLFKGFNYTPIKLSRDKFTPIPKGETDRKISFIDGGNMELFSSPMFSVHLIRIYYNVFKGKKRIEPGSIPQRIDFYALASASELDGEIKYQGRLYPITPEHKKYLPDESDLELKLSEVVGEPDEQLNMSRIGRVCTAARRFAEWKVAGDISKQELSSGDIMVMDGSLQTSVKNETKYAEYAYRKALTNDVVYSGLSKTTTLHTTTGNSLVKALKDLATDIDKPWYYYPVVKNTDPNHRAEIFFVKLYSTSEYAFRYELQRDWMDEVGEKEIESVLTALSNNSRDVRFPGYPYGLIDADRMASVSKEEASRYRARFRAMTEGNDLWNELRGYLSAVDAHDVLNKIR